jgi:ribonuclease D
MDVDSGAQAQLAALALSSARELAVDAELDALHAFRPRLCFLQLATDDAVYLFDTLHPDVRPEALAALFADAQKTKYFHAAGGDLSYLVQAGVRVQGLFDTHRAATLLGWPKVGLADLARELLGVELAKEHQQADFAVRPLPPEMRAYIADDVRYLCEIGRRVHKACADADILEELGLDCQRMCNEAAVPLEAHLIRPKVPRGQLSPEIVSVALAVAEGLHQRRVAWAEAADVPLGKMLSNAALVGIATERPSTLKELLRIQGVRRPFAREHGEEVLAWVRLVQERAQKGELTVEPPPVRDAKKKKREEALKAFRAEKAALRKVTASVVLPNPLLMDLAAQPPANVEALAQFPYFGAKRVALYGADLVALLSPD